jgi:hypothetical protein
MPRPFASAVLASALFALANLGAAAEAADRRLVIPGTTYVLVGGASQIDESGMPKRALTASLATWLSGAFEMPIPSELPKVMRVSSDILIEMRYGGLALDKSGETATQGAYSGAADILAVYDDRTRTVFLSDDWTGRDPGEISVLLHEMVHHLQNLAGGKYSCPGEREKLAYEAQARFLGLFGQSLEGVFTLDPMTLLVRTTCAM